MKATIILLCLILLSCTVIIISAESCLHETNGHIILTNRGRFDFPNGTTLLTGSVSICINGTSYPVCANGLNTTLGIAPDANLTGVCRLTQPYQNYDHVPGLYIGQVSDYYTHSNDVKTSIQCPYDDNGNPVPCTYTNGTSGCGAFGNEAVITCIQRLTTPVCSEGFLQLSNYTEYRSPNRIIRTGRVEICYNSTLYTVCDNTAYADYMAQQACNNAIHIDANYTIVPYESIYYNRDAHLVIHSCSGIPPHSSDLESYCTITRSSNTQCSSSPLTVKCSLECAHFGDVRLTQTSTQFYNNGTSGLIGNLQFCIDNTWTGICATDSAPFNNYNATKFCQAFGYENGTILSSNPVGVSNASRYSTLSCPSNDYYGPSSCSEMANDDTMCSSHVHDAVLYCYDAAPHNCDDSQVRFGPYVNDNPFIEGRFPNYTSYDIGSIEICANGTYGDVCHDTLTPELALTLCKTINSRYAIAYTYSIIDIINDRISYDDNAHGLYNIGCTPGVSTYSGTCTYSQTSNTGCTNYGGPAVITCVREEDGPCLYGTLNFASQGCGQFSNGTGFTIGRPYFCENSTASPFCYSLTQNDVISLCANSRGSFGGRPFPIIGSDSDFPLSFSSTRVLSNLTCYATDYSYGFYDCQKEFTNTSGGCPGNIEEATITCVSLPRPCHLETTLNYLSGTSYSTGSNYYSYTDYSQVRLCYNNTHGQVCADGVTHEVANTICRNSGYLSGYVTQEYSDYTYISHSTNYTGLDCSGSTCGANASPTGSCSNHGGLLIVACFYEYTYATCNPGELMFNYTDNTTVGSNYYVSGYPLVCVNESFVPICSQATINQLSTHYFCSFVGLLGGYYGTLPSMSLSPLNITNVSSVVTSLTCTPGDHYNCMNQTINGTCANLGGNLTLTCQYVCDNSTYRPWLFNNYTSIINGVQSIVGIPQRCVHGTYGRFCNDGTNFPLLATALCHEINFLYGSVFTPPANSNLQDGSPQGIYYINNVTCTGSNIDSCTTGASTNPLCYSGALNLVIQCNNGTGSCIGSGLSLFNRTTTVANGLQVDTGLMVNCQEGRYTTLCNDNTFSQAKANQLCVFMGYQSGISLPPASVLFGGLPQGITYYSNLECPSNAADISDCDVVESPSCNTQGIQDVVLQCTKVYVPTSTGIPTPTATPTGTSGSNTGVSAVVGVVVSLIIALVVIMY